jgi:hypothetical protein
MMLNKTANRKQWLLLVVNTIKKEMVIVSLLLHDVVNSFGYLARLKQLAWQNICLICIRDSYD